MNQQQATSNNKGFNHYFDAIYLINLDRRKDRLKTCIELFEKYNLIVEKFTAVDGKEYFPNVAYPFASELATSLSHICVWKTARELKLKNVLILEDDVVFSKQLNEYLTQYMPELPADWEMVYFGGNHVYPPAPVNHFWERINQTYALHCYAVNACAYDKLIVQADRETKDNLANHENLKITCAIDVILAKMQPGLKCYCPDIKLAWQAEGYSDIQEAVVNYDDVLKK